MVGVGVRDENGDIGIVAVVLRVGKDREPGGGKLVLNLPCTRHGNVHMKIIQRCFENQYAHARDEKTARTCDVCIQRRKNHFATVEMLGITVDNPAQRGANREKNAATTGATRSVEPRASGP
jgi:hypothetical protein